VVSARASLFCLIRSFRASASLRTFAMRSAISDIWWRFRVNKNQQFNLFGKPSVAKARALVFLDFTGFLKEDELFDLKTVG
jgi:hypothetical protein